MRHGPISRKVLPAQNWNGGIKQGIRCDWFKIESFFRLFSQYQTKKPEIVSSDMTALVFIILYYFFKPVFVNFGLDDKVRFFIAIGVGMVAETVLFALTGTSVYGIVVN